MRGSRSRYGRLSMSMCGSRAAQSWYLFCWAVVSGWRGQGESEVLGVALGSSVWFYIRVDRVDCA